MVILNSSLKCHFVTVFSYTNTVIEPSYSINNVPVAFIDAKRNFTNFAI